MNPDKIDYILDYFSRFMNEAEALAWRHWSTEYKIINSDIPEESKANRRRVSLKNGWLTTDEKVLELLKDGIEEYSKNTASRILLEHQEELFFNNCPKCNKLARTPFAKQCRFCGHDWH